MLDISDRITVTATGDSDLGINEDFFVESMFHKVTKSGTSHKVELTVSPVDALGDAWILGTSQLGTDTRLLF